MENRYGQLGDGTTTSCHSPIWIMDDVTYVVNSDSAFGAHVAAIRSDGSLWTWGNNRNGQLGDGTDIDRHSPVKIMDDVENIALSGNSTMAIKSDGSLWGWGSNWNGKLGDGTTVEYHYSPIKIMDDVAYVSVGGNHAMAIKTDGSLWGWGHNISGQIGDGTDDFGAHHLSPVQIMEDVVSVSAFGAHTMAIKSDGSLWAWGRNMESQLGDGTDESRNRPTRIMEDVVSVSSDSHTLAIRGDGSLWAWGNNANGELGIGLNRSYSSPILVTKP